MNPSISTRLSLIETCMIENDQVVPEIQHFENHFLPKSMFSFDFPLDFQMHPVSRHFKMPGKQREIKRKTSIWGQ